MKKLLNRKNSTIISLIFALLGDILIFPYLYNRFTDGIGIFQEMLKIAFEQNGLDYSKLDSNFIREQFEFYCSLLALLLIIIFAFHIIIYALHLFDKKISKLYLMVYAVAAVPGCLVMAVTMISSSPLYALLFLAQSGMYLFIVLTMIHFRTKS